MAVIGIPREIHPGEKRVAGTPQTILKLKKLGFDVVVETGAGEAIDCSDGEYQEAGAAIVENAAELWAASDVVIKVRPPEDGETELMRDGGWLVGFVWPGQNRDIVDRMAKKNATVFAMDSVPRITRAQKMDTLSAMANIAGYRAIIEAANNFPRFFTGQITAAGKIDPAKVLVIGAGVAGLSAIGAAKGLGAIVRAFDPRSATKDQVASMGAEYLELDVKEEGEGKGGYAKEMSDAFLKAEMALFAQQAMQVDIIVTTALIPGKPAPKLITQGMVESMKPGSVIVDLAAEQGGNCALTEPGKVVRHKGVTIIGYTDLPSRMASMSSQLYGATVTALLADLQDENGDLHVDLEDEVVRGAIVLDKGKMLWPPPLPPAPPEPGVPTKSSASVAVAKAASGAHGAEEGSGMHPLVLVAVGVVLLGLGYFVPDNKLSHFTVFMLAVFVGFQVVWNVKPALHTPLMSVTNAISGIILVGGMLQLSGDLSVTTILGAIAVLIATINIVGGFLVTNRMLAMFRK
ncbi:MAG: Re/Si-specific NAD(P)(+) transhydrogenase subunit alpha [Blastocatellia bacterium]|nr:Re/Si-specific NAD(P)(+) transhydrogenase subunit alpha [Chloracidobacterium sp.]MBL8183920.1 Re/Si-specific NAD(P)(+) transhydrogenase subunit alpha [Blastocatellia bacterium]HBE82134.1 Re/Si-specific NAD(P)(+) transhydrogenase subunit alpha [Blastocatellia bacterium]HRJ90324.1 Re/Si-specific NAD(P)(+) transhydrogenase subunit alpha [Pyrinomonadaceae bacterium]HRK49522.1 Re/Si-specific NAD(P)(+) transhydrogenase subunit alpha [Pyrinomonadaceae bacterium]